MTVLPVAAALVALVGAAVLAARHLLPAWPALLLAGLAVAVRLAWLPALARPLHDGHEDTFYQLFLGVAQPDPGGTLAPPALQWAWWLLGQLLPRAEPVPVVVSALLGVVSIGAVAGAVGSLSRPSAGWLAACMLALHPAHAAWSTSAYSVMPAQAAAGLSLLAAARWVATEPPGGRRPAPGRGALIWMSAAALVLAVACRIETALWAVPVALVVLLRRRRADPRLPASWMFAAALAAAAGGLAARPVLASEIPGAGERALAFTVNLPMVAYYAPFDRLLGLSLVVVGGAAALRRWPGSTVALLAGAVLGHLALATFDDFGERHALSALPFVAWALAAGALALPRLAGLAVGLAAAVLSLAGLVDLRERFHGSEDAFADVLSESPWRGLPRVSLAEAAPPDCGWVAEDSRVARDPPRSHFNLLDPAEAASLRGSDGCLRWCLDAADWRWSSRAVRDRAQRLSRLYTLRPAAVVTEQDSGYQCLVLDVGPRRCCDEAAPSTPSETTDSTIPDLP